MIKHHIADACVISHASDSAICLDGQIFSGSDADLTVTNVNLRQNLANWFLVVVGYAWCDSSG